MVYKEVEMYGKGKVYSVVCFFPPKKLFRSDLNKGVLRFGWTSTRLGPV